MNGGIAQVPITHGLIVLLCLFGILMLAELIDWLIGTEEDDG